MKRMLESSHFGSILAMLGGRRTICRGFRLASRGDEIGMREPDRPADRVTGT